MKAKEAPWLRVLVCAPMFLKHKKGTRFRALELSKALGDAGAEVHVAAYNLPKLESVAFHKLPKSKRIFFGGPLNQIIELFKIANDVKPDIIFAQTQWGMFLSVVVGGALQIPVITDIHSPYLEDFSLLRGAYGQGSLRYFLRKKQEDFFISFCAALTTVSSTLAEVYQKKGKEVFVVRNGINPALFSNTGKKADDLERKKRGRLVVSYLGNFNPYQGVGLLLDSAGEVLKTDKGYLFVFVGGSQKHLKNELKGLPKENLYLRGRVERSEALQYLNSSDILVIPRSWSKLAHLAFPYKLVEYMGSGKPVIATDISDHGKLIKDGQTGLLIKPDKDELTKALLRLRDEKLRKRLGKNARDLVFKVYRYAKIGRELNGILSMFAKRR